MSIMPWEYFGNLPSYNSSLISACGNFTYDTSAIHLALGNINQTLTNVQCFDMCRSKAVLDIHTPIINTFIIVIVIVSLNMLISFLSPRYAALSSIISSVIILLMILVNFI